MVVDLNEEDFATLLVMLGYATGAARRQGERELSIRFVKLANTINRDNPNWTPYQVSDDEIHS